MKKSMGITEGIFSSFSHPNLNDDDVVERKALYNKVASYYTT